MNFPVEKNQVTSRPVVCFILYLKQFTLTISFLVFFNLSAFPQLENEVSKTWQYTKIYDKEGKAGRRIGAHDLMTLRREDDKNTFSYALQLEDIKAWGNWTLDDSTMVFDYAAVASGPSKSSSDKPGIRRFRIIKITSEELLIREVTQADRPGLFFEFRYFAD
jgi:hypothetical protein